VSSINWKRLDIESSNLYKAKKGPLSSNPRPGDYEVGPIGQSGPVMANNPKDSEVFVRSRRITPVGPA